MKTKRLLSKILSAGFLISLIILVVMSCKKKDDDPVPVPPAPVPPPTNTPAVFANKIPKLMTEYEVNNNKVFFGHYLRAMGKSMCTEPDPEDPIDFPEIGKSLWEVHDYLHTEHEFDKINTDLDSLLSDATELKSMITQLGTDIKMQTTALENFFITGAIYNQLTQINTEYSHANAGTYGYFMYVGAQYEKDSVAWAVAMNTQSQNVTSYATSQFTPANPSAPTPMAVAVQAIHDYLTVPAPGSFTGLHLYNQNLINGAYPVIGGSPENAMKAYQMLENYFLWALTAQYQAQNILTNSANVLDPDSTQHYASTTWDNYQLLMVDEVTAFLTEVNWFVVNIDDYRTPARWNQDIQNGDAGLTQDCITFDVLARAQFVANAIYDGIGLPYPVMCGRVITPWNYTNGASQVATQLTLNIGNKTLVSNAVKIPSMIPYTFWVAGDPATCSYDNQWNVYSYGTMGQGDPGWGAKNTLNVACSDQYHPWTHSAGTINGTVDTYFYNPQNLNDKSSSYDKVHCMQFGFFSANWKWGYMYLRYSTDTWHACGAFCPAQMYEYGCQNSNNGSEYGLLECGSGVNGFSATTPYVVGDNDSWRGCTQDAYNNGFGYGGDIGLSQMTYEGSSFNYSGGQISYVHNVFLNFKTPNVISGKQAWFATASQSYYGNNNSNNQSNLTVSGGTGLSHPCNNNNGKSGYNVNTGDLFQYSNTTPGTWTSLRTTWGGNFGANNQQAVNFGFEFFVNRANSGNSNTIILKQSTAVIFGGYALSTCP